ncbi:MAG: hypothetical protein ACKN9W_07510 [Methylococcus sp.]
MWPFIREKRKPTEEHGTDNPKRRPLRFAALVADMGDFRALSDNDTAVKFWVPTAVAEALDELRERDGYSMSHLLRQYLIVHCYGLYALRLMLEANPHLFKDREIESEIRFSRTSSPPTNKRAVTYFVPELGKNVAPIKLWIPQRLRDDLQILADHVGLKLSQYLREIVIARLLGHGTLPMRPEMLQASPNPAADDWDEDREVPWRVVSRDEYQTARVGKIEVDRDEGGTEEEK